MKKLLLIFIGLLITLCAQPAHAEVFNLEPSQVILKSAVANVNVIDSFFVSANPGGLSIFVYDQSLDAYNYINSLKLDIDSCLTKRYDSVLVLCEINSNRILFVNVNNLPELNLLGEVIINHDFHDFILNDSSLYLSGYFDGVYEYHLNSYNSVSFEDSTMIGILNTQMELVNDTLYVLDEYNGILRFDLNTPGFGTFIDYLYIPLRVSSFEQMDSLFVVMLRDKGVYIADFNSYETPAVIDSIGEITNPHKIFYTDSLLLVYSRHEMRVFDKVKYKQVSIYDTDNNLSSGEIYALNGTPYLMLPLITGGVSIYDLKNGTPPIQGLSHTSSISDMVYSNDQLYISGPSESVKVLSFNEFGSLQINYKILDSFNNSSYFDKNGDSLFVLAPEHNIVAFMMNVDNPDSANIVNTISYEGSGKDIFYNTTMINNLNLLLIQKQSSVQVFWVGQNGTLFDKGEWNFITSIDHIALKDSTLFVSTQKNELLIYRINQYFGLRYLNGYSLTGNTTDMLLVDTMVLAVENNKLHNFIVTDAGVIARGMTYLLDYPVIDMKYYNERLYTIGYEGIAIYSLLDFYPTLEQFGGSPGKLIEVNQDYIIASDGDGILVYNTFIPPIGDQPEDESDSLFIPFDISNYPNPFNGQTNISFILPAESDVTLEVYNLLGQKVKTLVDGKYSSGRHEIIWEGTNDNNQNVSTGIYFYRLAMPDKHYVGKMIFLK